MIAGANTPPIYYTFFCDEIHCKIWFVEFIYWLCVFVDLRNLYLALVYFFCISAFILMLVPRFNQPRYIVLRGTTFVLCGLLSAIPCIHMEFWLDPIYIEDFLVFPWLLGGIIYIFGACLYMFKIPERCKPGTFDICVKY